MTAVGRLRWTRRRWIGTVAAVLAIQVAAVALLVRPPPPLPARTAMGTRVHLVPPETPDQAFDVGSALVDPAVFALPSVHGFSGSAWLRYPLLQPKPAEHAVTPEWLSPAPGTLGAELARFLSTNTLAPVLMVDEPLPSVLRYGTSFSGEPVGPSRLRIDGEISRRPILGSTELPSWAHTDIVSNTVIRAAVNGAGLTFSATLLSRSGLPAADDYALQFVENARFRPAASVGTGPFRRDELSWGTFVFLWHTRPLLVTNAPSALP